MLISLYGYSTGLVLRILILIIVVIKITVSNLYTELNCWNLFLFNIGIIISIMIDIAIIINPLSLLLIDRRIE